MRSMGIVVAGIVVGLLLAGGLAGNAIGQTTYNWTNTGASSWFTAGNWNPSGPPTAGHRGRINSGGTAQIAGGTATVGYNSEEGSLVIDSSEGVGGLGGNLEVNAGGVLDMNGAGLHVGAGGPDGTIGTLTVNGGMVTNLARVLEVSRYGKGLMTINSGSVFYSGLWVSHYTPSGVAPWGRIEMNGGQLVRTGSSGSFVVGAVGTGAVIMAGGLIDDNVNGAYANTLNVGYGGVGEFLQSGGTSRWNVVEIKLGTITVTNNARLEMGRGTTAHNKNINMFNDSALNVQAGGEIVGLGTSGQRRILAGENTGATGVVTMTGGRIDFTDASADSGIYLGTDEYGGTSGAGVGLFNMSGGFAVLRNLNVGQTTGGKGIATLSGGTLSNTVLRIGGESTAATASSTGTVTISGTHVLIPNGVTVGVYNNCQGTLNMSGGTVSNASQGMDFALGSGARAYGTLTGGVMHVSGLRMGLGDNSRAEVSMGGTFALRSAGSVTIGNSGAGSYAQLSISNDAAVTIDGDNLHLGANSGGTGIVNMAGGTVTLTQTADNRGVDIGRGGPGTLNLSGGTLECQQVYYDRYNTSSSHILVSGGTLYARNGIVVQGSGAGSTLVATGGVVDFGTGDLTVNSDNSVTNAGGVFQFRKSNPTITPGTFGTIVFDSGTMSFRGISDADVFCNQNGKPWSYNADINYLGNNAFRLNCATNLSGSQAYTFTDTLGSTNFARLDLLNGSLYRGGNVTIGAGGTLTVTGAVSTIANNLTLQAGGTYRVTLDAGGAMSRVAVNGDVALGGTLVIGLASAPQPGELYTVLDNQGASPVSGSFGSVVEATYGGRSYAFLVRTTGGTGNDVVVGLARGTVISIK